MDVYHCASQIEDIFVVSLIKSNYNYRKRMIDKVNMSLDEIIRTTKRAGVGGPGGTRGGRRTNNNNNSNGIGRRTGRANGVAVTSLARPFKPERQFGGRTTNRIVPKVFV